MTLEKNGFKITIADDSPMAQQIVAGYDFTIDTKGNIIIGNIGTDVDNKYQAIRAINNISNLSELKTVLIKIVKKLL